MSATFGIQAQLDEPVDIGEVVGDERAQRVHLRGEALGEHAFRIVPSSPGDCHAIGRGGVVDRAYPSRKRFATVGMGSMTPGTAFYRLLTFPASLRRKRAARAPVNSIEV